jgi:WD40 repeat protein
VTTLVFSNDKKFLISGSWDKNIKIWELNTGIDIQTLKGHSSRVTSVAISHDDLYIISGSDDYSIKIWESKTGN